MLSKSALLWLGIALGSVGLAYVVYLNQATLILLGISFVVAYLLDPSIDRLERRGLSRTLAISLLIGVILVSVGVLFLVDYSPVTVPGALMWLVVRPTGDSGSMSMSLLCWRW